LIEVEGILNSRPLTYVYEDFEEPLTPASLCIGRRLLTPTPRFQGSTELSRRQKHLDLILKHFWSCWRNEYLSELREHHHGKTSTQSRVIRQGDVVGIHDNCLPRQRWKLGTVQELIHGRDGLVRAAIVRVLSKGVTTEIKRPVQRLYPVEVSCEQTDGGKKERAVTAVPAIRFVPNEQVEFVRCD